MRGTKVLGLVVLALLIFGSRTVDAHRQLRWTIEDLLALDVKPFAIAHRGFGDNLRADDTGPVDSARPIENTVAAIRHGFKAGAAVVEVDVQLTRDGRVAVFHDDFLADQTCLNQSTLDELQDRLPFVPSLEAVLDTARTFNHGRHLSGLVIVELKWAAPLCDPHDTQDRAIVRAVSRVVRRMGMSEQVMFASFSPALLFLASEHAPEITRDLSVSGLQFLTADQVKQALGFTPVLIDKKLSLGLQWAEVGPLFRLPAYQSIDQVLATAVAVRARVIEADLLFLNTAGAPFVAAVHQFGFKALGFTATNPAEWSYLESLGLDGVYTSDIPFGVAHEALMP